MKNKKKRGSGGGGVDVLVLAEFSCFFFILELHS